MTHGITDRHVVVGVDGSAGAAQAAAWAASEAASRDVALQLVYAQGSPYTAGMVMPLPYAEYDRRQPAAADRLFARALKPLRRAHPDLPITTAFAQNAAARALVAASETADLLVVGSRGRGGFAGLLLGSVGLSVAAHAACPTVIVHRETPHDAGRPEIVLGLDDDEPEPPISYAFAAARRAGADVRGVHVWHLSPYGYGEELDRTEETKVLDSVLRRARGSFPDVTATTEIARGNPAGRLLEAAAGARLLVVGSHRRHGPLSPGLGLVVHGLIHHAPCPIAVVPAT